MKPILLFLGLLLSSHSFCQTPISGAIYNNATWTKANSPYIVSGNLVVFDNVTLTVEPGVSVMFDAGAQIELRGRLEAVGTAIDTISFVGSQDDWNWWKGIKALSASSAGTGNQLNFEHCYFANAQLLFDLDIAYEGPYNFKKSTFYKNTVINNDEPLGGMYIDRCLFFQNKTGPYGGGDFGRVYVTNSWFVNNEIGMRGGNVDSCVFIGNTVMGAYMYQNITNSIFYNNKVGILADHHHDTRIQNNEIHNNEIGIEIDRMWQDDNIILRNNKICNNIKWNIQYNYINSVDISQNCWCTNDSLTIRSKIRDGYVDTQFGLLNFYTWLDCELTNPNPTKIETVNKTPILKAYPNPSTDILVLELEGNNNTTIMVTDMVGRKVYNTTSAINKHTLDTRLWTPGIYMVKYTIDNQSNIIKVVKE